MASEAQIRANRLNAGKSTGPRTAEGKAKASQNAVRHGLRAEKMVIKGEDLGEFEFYRDAMLGELAPAGALEAMLAERVVGLAWRLRRAERIQTEVFDALLTDDATNPVKRLLRSMQAKAANGPGEGASALGRVAVRDFGGERVLYRLGMYERRIEHSLYKTLNELEKLRLLRELDEPVRPACGSVKAAGLGDGGMASEEDHRQASLDAATQPTEEPVRQTKPISAILGQENRSEGQGKANRSQLGQSIDPRKRGLVRSAQRVVPVPAFAARRT